MDEQKSHSPTLFYIGTISSSGIFLFYWLYLLMRDINRTSGLQIFNSKIWLSILIMAFIIMMSLVIYVIYTLNISADVELSLPTHFQLVQYAAISSGLFLVTVIFAIVIKIYKQILVMQGRKMSLSDVLFIVAQTLLMYTSLPYLQSKLNSLNKGRKR